jgi:hypothetical protein
LKSHKWDEDFGPKEKKWPSTRFLVTAAHLRYCYMLDLQRCYMLDLRHCYMLDLSPVFSFETGNRHISPAIAIKSLAMNLCHRSNIVMS